MIRELLHKVGIHKWYYDSYYGYEVYRTCELCFKVQRWSIRLGYWITEDD